MHLYIIRLIRRAIDEKKNGRYIEGISTNESNPSEASLFMRRRRCPVACRRASTKYNITIVRTEYEIYTKDEYFDKIFNEEVKYMLNSNYLNSNSNYLNSFVNKNQSLLSLEEEILQKAQFINISADIVKDTSKDLLQEDKIYMEWFRDMMEYDYLKGCFIDDKKTYKKSEVNKLIEDALVGKFEYNRFFIPNQGIYDKRGKKRDENGLIKYDYFTEKRSEDKVKDLKCFYIDIDIKDEHGKSYVNDIDVENKKRQLLSELKKLWKKNEYPNTNLDQIIVPSIVVESRNGFHLYYVIDLNWYKTIESTTYDAEYPSLKEWKELEKIILLTYKKFIPIVDNAVVTPGQLLRFPYTIHQKDVKQNPFLVRILFMGRKYTMDELSIDFILGMDESMLREVYPDEYTNVEKSNDKSGTYQKKTIQSKKISVSEEDFSKNLPNSQLVTAIQNLDVQYFKNNIGNVKLQNIPDRKAAINYIHSQDMRKFLGIKVRLETENFNNPFRKDDENASASIFKGNQGKYILYDHATKESNMLLNIIEKVAKISMTKAVDFLAEIYNIETSQFQPYINLSQLEDIIHKNEDLFSENIKLNKLNKKLIILYKECLEFWKEKCIENQSIPFLKHDIMISNDTMFKRLQEKYLDSNPFKRPQDLTRRFMQLEALGVVKLIRGKNFNTETKIRAARVYQFKKINVNEFSMKCMILKRKCPNIKEMGEKIIRMVDMTYEIECKKQLISKLIQIIKNIK